MLLVLSVMLSLYVPFEVKVSAEGTAATDDSIYALLYIKDTSKTTTGTYNAYQDGNVKYNASYNLELVFQNDATAAAGRVCLKTYHLDANNGNKPFASVCYHTRTLKNGSDVVNIDKSNSGITPWYDKDTTLFSSDSDRVSRNIVSVDFRDEIAPTYIACWGSTAFCESASSTTLRT